MPESELVHSLREQIASQAEAITWLKWIIAGLGGALVSVCGFFVAWVRTLYDGRHTEQTEQTKARDALIERVLSMLATVAEILRRQKAGDA